MRNEAAENFVNDTARRAPRVARRVLLPPGPVVTEMDLKIVDAAFADLETTILRCDDPVPRHRTPDKLSPYQGMVQQLAVQLRTLDEQRAHLATLLRDLQTPAQADA